MYLLVILFILFDFVITKNAYAYLDPGTGSYILQMIIGALIGALFAIKIYWRRIIKFFNDIFTRKKD